MEQNLSFSADRVKRVRMKLAWAQVEIVAGTAAEHQLMIAGDDESIGELRVEHTGEDIVVVQPQMAYAKEVLQRSRWLQICLRVPQGFQGDLDVDTVSGPIGTHKITGGDISLSTIGAPVRVKGVACGNLWLHTVSGAIAGEKLRASRGNLRTISGMVSLEDVTFGATKVFTVSGEVNLSLCEGCRTFDMQSVSGAACIEVIGPAKASMHSLSGQFLLGEGVESAPGCLEISASSVSGDLAVKRKGFLTKSS